MARIGYYALLLYLFLYLSRILDITLPGLRITLILNVIFLGAAVLSGGVVHFFRSRIGLLVVGFYCWMAVSFPFSVWKGGSVTSMVQTARSLVLMMTIVALLSSTRDCLRLLYTIGFAEATAGLVGRLAGGQSRTQRLVISEGSFADPNLYCVYLYVGMPFLWLAARNASHPFKKVVCLGASLLILATGVATGSRAGFAALCVIMVLLFLRLPALRRVRLIVGASIMLAGASLVFSDYILQRYTSFLEAQPQTQEGLSEEQMQYLQSAATSTAGRLHLLHRSLILTLQNPLFGVGPGMFMVAEDQYARAQGERRGNWHETHNTYTQVSAEAGLPAFLLYTSALFLAIRTVGRLRKALTPAATPEQESVRNAAVYLEVSFAGALTAAMFLSIAYTGLLYVLTGLIVALGRTAAREYLAPVRAAGPAASPLPPGGPPTPLPAGARPPSFAGGR